MNSFLTPSIADFIKKHADDDVRKLALCKNSISGDELKFALQQIEGRQKAKQKLTSWASNENIIFPVKLSMEQCSSEQTAKYKQSIAGVGKLMADLTGGFGIDFFYISKNYQQAYYVEMNKELCEIARHNFDILDKGCEVCNTNANDFLTEHQNQTFDLLYIDPARRDANGRKTVAPSDCLPDLTQMQTILRNQSKKVIVKYSPMLDIQTAIKELDGISGIYVISVNNECKELLLIQDFLKKDSPIKVTCTNINKEVIEEFSFSYEEEKESPVEIASSIGNYIYEPNSSIMKAGAYRTITKEWSIKPLEINSHLYTSDNLIDGFQGRKFKVLGTCKLNKKDFGNQFPNINQANISVRNCPFKPDEIRKKLKLKEGGDFYIFATTLSDKSIVIIGCKKC